MPLVTPKKAALALGVSHRHVQTLIHEADVFPKRSRWRFGKQIIDLTKSTATRRTLRINLDAVVAPCP
jgi:hypothetical protein